MNTPGKSVFRTVIAAPIDRVWAELTRTDIKLPFFFNARCDATEMAVGNPLRMRSGTREQWTGVVGEILEFEPPHRYAHTFKFTNLDDAPCKVTYELREVDGGTEFTLTNEDVPVGTKTEKYMLQGGKFIVDNLKAVVETGRPTFGGRLLLSLIALMAPFTPKRSSSDRWPLS